MNNSFPSINKGILRIYLFAAIVSIVGELLDAWVYSNRDPNIVVINSIAAFIILLSLILYFTKVAKLSLAFTLTLYAILLNSLFARYFGVAPEYFSEVFFRDSIFVIIVLVLASFSINKAHAYIISIVQVINFWGLSYYHNDEFLKENTLLMSLIFISFGIIVYYFVGVLEKSMKGLNRSNRLVEDKNEEIENQNYLLIQQKEEIQSQRDDVETQKTIIESKNREILQSIRYAKTIQEAILPKKKLLKKHFAEYFILHYPKDQISGDFYWLKEENDKIYVAAVDCTGHGVAGALVSMIGLISLNHSLIELKLSDPGKILNAADEMIISEIENKTNFSSPIGMDIALVAIDKKNMKMQYAGAFNPLYIVRKGKLIEFKPDKFYIGMDNDKIPTKKFKTSKIDIIEGDIIYLFSDGFVDQFGGDKDKKYGHKQFKNLLLKHSKLPLSEQRKALLNEHKEWKGKQEQTDDLIIVGFKI